MLITGQLLTEDGVNPESARQNKRHVRNSDNRVVSKEYV